MKNTKRLKFRHLMVSLLCTTLPLLAHAGENDPWQVSIGAGASYAPRYEGAANYRWRLVPLLDISYTKGGFFIGATRGIGFNFSKVKYLQYGVRVLLGPARSQSEDPRLYGLGDIDYYPESGVFLSTQLGPLSLSSGVSNSTYGTRADLGCGLGFPIGEHNRFRLSARANWGDANYNQTFFGVTAAQSAASGGVLAPYTAVEGKKDTVFSASWTHNFDKEWFSATTLTHKRLEGSAQLSPIVERTSMNSISLMLGYHF
jgi:outer membrane protein